MASENLQTIIVSKETAKTRAAAERIARPHANRIYSSRETKSSWRFSQRPPGDFVKNSFRSFTLPGEDGVVLVYGKLKRSKNPTSQRWLQFRDGDHHQTLMAEWDFWMTWRLAIPKAENEDDLRKLIRASDKRKIKSVLIRGLINQDIGARARHLKITRMPETIAADERIVRLLREGRMGNPSTPPKASPSSFEAADKGALELGRELRGEPWFRGATVKPRGSGYIIEVDAAPRAKHGLPDAHRGVPIRIRSRRGVKKLKKNKGKAPKTKKSVKTKSPKHIVLRSPKQMPDPGPCAWLGSIVEWSWEMKPGERSKKVDENGNAIWDPKSEWMFMWSPKYKAVVSIRRPRNMYKLAEVSRYGGAAKMFEVFMARQAENTFEVIVPDVPLQKVGEKAAHIVYRSDKWSPKRLESDWIHPFGNGVQLYCGPSIKNPEVFICFGGKLTMTKRGLVW